MRLRLDATEDELLAKGDALVAELAEAVQSIHPDLAERLHKALPDPDTQRLPYPAMRELQSKFAGAYAAQMDAMHKDICRALDRAAREVRKGDWADDTDFRKSDLTAQANDEGYVRTPLDARIRSLVLRRTQHLPTDFAPGGVLAGRGETELLAMVRAHDDILKHTDRPVEDFSPCGPLFGQTSAVLQAVLAAERRSA